MNVPKSRYRLDASSGRPLPLQLLHAGQGLTQRPHIQVRGSMCFAGLPIAQGTCVPENMTSGDLGATLTNANSPMSRWQEGLSSGSLYAEQAFFCSSQ